MKGTVNIRNSTKGKRCNQNGQHDYLSAGELGLPMLRRWRSITLDLRRAFLSSSSSCCSMSNVELLTPKDKVRIWYQIKTLEQSAHSIYINNEKLRSLCFSPVIELVKQEFQFNYNNKQDLYPYNYKTFSYIGLVPIQLQDLLLYRSKFF